MSEAVADRGRDYAAQPGRSVQAGIFVGMCCFYLFAAAAWQLIRHGYVLPFNAAYWDAALSPFVVGGQWLTIALLSLARLVPGSSPASAAIFTVVAAAVLEGWLARTLLRRGWTPLQAALACGLTALHPVMLYMAISGSTLLLVSIVAGTVVLALDRVEAIGDTQALIVLGIMIALLFVVWPNAIYFGAFVLLVLPVANREVRSTSATLACYFIAGAPTFILVASFALGASLFGVSVRNVLAVWSAPLHGAPARLVAESAWLQAYGGRLWQPFLTLILLCFALTPRLFTILQRLMLRRAERARPVTAVVALLGPSVAGALTTYFWHLISPFSTVALSLAASTVWTVTAQLNSRERWLWIAMIVIGVVVGWTSPLLWRDTDTMAWRAALLAYPWHD